MPGSVSDKPLNQDKNDTVRDEDQLIKKSREDPAQFADLYRRYVDPIYYYLLARVGNVRDAEDLTAEVFLQALEGLENYRHRGHFAAWLFTIARRRAADYHRGQPRVLNVSTLQNVSGQKSEPLQDMIHQQELKDLEKVVEDLPEEKQELLRLRCAAGLTFHEMAAVLDRSESAVKMAYYRLLDRLETLLMLE